MKNKFFVRTVLAVGVFAILFLSKLMSADAVASTVKIDALVSIPQTAGLHYAAESPGSKVAVEEALNAYYSPPDFSSNHLPWMADRSKLEIQPPIAHYKLAAIDVTGSKGLAGAQLINFTYFIKKSGQTVDQIDLLPNDNGTFSKNAGYVRGLGPGALAKSPYLLSLAQASALAQVRQGSYEIRLLDLAPFKSVRTGLASENTVLWLKSDRPGGDLIYTFAQDAYREIQPGLQPSTLYSAEDMLKAIRPAVLQLQEIQARTLPPDTNFVEAKSNPAGEPMKGLHSAPLTTGTKEAVIAALNAYFTSPDDGSPLRKADRSKLQVQQPLARYTLSAANVLNNRGLETAKLLSYTCEIKLADKTVGQVMLTPLPNGMLRQGSGLADAIYANEQSNTLEHWVAQAESLDAVRQGSFEVRLLNLPPYGQSPIGEPISGVVLWLKSNTPGDDLVYTLSANTSLPEPGLQPSTLYTVPEMLKAIRPAVAGVNNGKTGTP